MGSTCRTSPASQGRKGGSSAVALGGACQGVAATRLAHRPRSPRSALTWWQAGLLAVALRRFVRQLISAHQGDPLHRQRLAKPLPPGGFCTGRRREFAFCSHQAGCSGRHPPVKTARQVQRGAADALGAHTSSPALRSQACEVRVFEGPPRARSPVNQRRQRTSAAILNRASSWARHRRMYCGRGGGGWGWGKGVSTYCRRARTTLHPNPGTPPPTPVHPRTCRFCCEGWKDRWNWNTTRPSLPACTAQRLPPGQRQGLRWLGAQPGNVTRPGSSCRDHS